MAAAYPLATLISLRDRRCQSADLELRQRDKLLKLAVSELAQKQQELQDYLLFREEEIERRYRLILDKIKSQSELAEFNREIGRLYEKESELTAQIDTLKIKCQEAKDALQKAKLAAKAAQKALAKLQSHKEMWLFAQKRQEEFKADQELDDFKVKKVNF